MAQRVIGSRTVELMVSRALSPVARSQTIARHARRIINETANQNAQVLKTVPKYETVVDGRRTSALESVNPDRGVIVAIFELGFEILTDIEAWLILHSPHGPTGRYSRSHRFFADGIEAELAPNVTGKSFLFISTLPYARRIERGWSQQAPDGVYEGVAALARDRFGNMADIRFTFRAINEGGVQAYSDIALGGRKGGKTASAKKRAAYNAHNEMRYPAISIVMR